MQKKSVSEPLGRDSTELPPSTRVWNPQFDETCNLSRDVHWSANNIDILNGNDTNIQRGAPFKGHPHAPGVRPIRHHSQWLPIFFLSEGSNRLCLNTLLAVPFAGAVDS